MNLLRILFVFVILLGIASASYISGDIYINKEGRASFYLETDRNLSIDGLDFSEGKLRGETDLLTSKDKDIWTFILDLDEYETILIDLHFPNSIDKIFSTRGVDNVFDVEEKIVSLIDNNNKLYFEIKYNIKHEFSYGFILWILFSAAILFSIIFYIYRKKHSKMKLRQVFPFLNDNVKKIIELLMKQSLRQKEVREKLGIPKASFTRYVLNLEKRGIILREGEGKNKILKVK